MKKVFMSGLFCLFITSVGFSAETSNESKLYTFSSGNKVDTIQINADNTILADIQGLGICKGTIHGSGAFVQLKFVGESSEGGQCEAADLSFGNYRFETLKYLESFSVGISDVFLSHSALNPNIHELKVLRVK